MKEKREYFMDDSVNIGESFGVFILKNYNQKLIEIHKIHFTHRLKNRFFLSLIKYFCVDDRKMPNFYGR